MGRFKWILQGTDKIEIDRNIEITGNGGKGVELARTLFQMN